MHELAVWLLLFVAAFQIPDGLQVGAAGALRGFKDAHVPMALNFTAYWLIGFPAAWWFGIHQGFGPSGIWAGLIAGLVTCAVFLLLRYRQVTRRRVAASCLRGEGVEYMGIRGSGTGPGRASARDGLAGDGAGCNGNRAPAGVALPTAASQARRSAAKACTAGRLSRTARTAVATSTSR